MIEKAYAKINLALNVKDKRGDGFHNIESVMLPLKLHDSIEIEVRDSKNGDDFIVCDNFKVGIAKYNLCHRAIEVAREMWGFKESFDIHIHKSIFLQSGLGGGSSDAAVVLKAITKILKIKVKKDELIEAALKIGSDVPFMLFNKPSLVTGIGNVIENIDMANSFYDYYVLLCKPNEGISTTRIYNEFDQIENPAHFDIEKAVELVKTDNSELKKYIGNSLEKPGYSIVPEIENIKKSLVEKGFNMVFMTGGGSCVVGLTKNKKLARKTFKEYYINSNYEAELTKFLNQNKK